MVCTHASSKRWAEHKHTNSYVERSDVTPFFLKSMNWTSDKYESEV